MENKIEEERQKLNNKREDLLELYYDDIALSKEFESSVIHFINDYNLDTQSIIKEFDSKYMYKLNTTLSQDKTIKIAQKFFNEINPEFCNYFMMRIHDKRGIFHMLML